MAFVNFTLCTLCYKKKFQEKLNTKKIWFSIFLAAIAVLSGLCDTNKNEYNKSIAKNARFFAKNAMRFFILAAIL